MATAGSATDDGSLHIDVVDLRLLSQSELYSLSLCSSSSAAANLINRRCDEDAIIPKIDRSVFNESAGSRKQTFSRLRLAPRNNPVPSASAPNFHIPRHNLEPVDEENAQIIGLLQQLFGVESIRHEINRDDSLVPVQVEFKDLHAESATVAFQSVPIDIVDGSERKRKRGRPRKNENAVAVRVEEKAKKEDGEVMTIVNNNGVMVDAVALANVEDPFGEELNRRTRGLETESRLLEFLAGLHGEWASQRKKRRIVQASDFSDVLPRGWKIMLSLKRRAGHISIFCRRYISPNGHQFASCKEVSSYLISFFGLQAISHTKSNHTDDGLLFSSKMAFENGVGYVATGDMKSDDATGSLHITTVSTDHEKEAPMMSSTGSDKQNISHENVNNGPISGSQVKGTSGTSTDFSHQSCLLFGDEQHLKADENNANSVQGHVQESSFCNTHNEANTVAYKLEIPLVVTNSFSDNKNDGSCECRDELDVVRCTNSGINKFFSEDKNAVGYDAASCGSEQALLVKNNGHGLFVRTVEDPRQHIGLGSGMPGPNSEGEKCATDSVEDGHIISSLVDMKISDGKQFQNDKLPTISGNFQLEAKDVSKVESGSGGCLLDPFQDELELASINCEDQLLTFLTSDSARGKCIEDCTLSSSSIDARTCGASSCLTYGTCSQNAFEFGGFDIASNLVTKVCNMDVVTSCGQEMGDLNGQSFNCKLDNSSDRSFDRSVPTSTDNQSPSAFDNIANKVSSGSMEALKTAETGCKKPELETVSYRKDSAVDVQGRSQCCASISFSGTIPKQFNEQGHNGVNNADNSFLIEKANSEQVEICEKDEALLFFRGGQIKSDGNAVKNALYETMTK